MPAPPIGGLSCSGHLRFCNRFLVFNCTARCSIPSIVCGLLYLLLSVYPSHFRLSSSVFVVAESAISDCWKLPWCFLFWFHIGNDLRSSFLLPVSCLFWLLGWRNSSCALRQGFLFLGLLLLSHRSATWLVIRGFFFLALPSTSDAVSRSGAPCVFFLRLSMFYSSRLSAANLPPIVASNWSATSGSFLTNSRALLISAPRNVQLLARLMLDLNRRGARI